VLPPDLLTWDQAMCAGDDERLVTLREAMGRGLHSSTFQLNLGAFCGIGVCSAVV
jgi:hypothetical protein